MRLHFLNQWGHCWLVRLSFIFINNFWCVWFVENQVYTDLLLFHNIFRPVRLLLIFFCFFVGMCLIFTVSKCMYTNPSIIIPYNLSPFYLCFFFRGNCIQIVLLFHTSFRPGTPYAAQMIVHSGYTCTCHTCFVLHDKLISTSHGVHVRSLKFPFAQQTSL